jgi:hypothetical protein
MKQIFSGIILIVLNFNSLKGFFTGVFSPKMLESLIKCNITQGVESFGMYAVL